MRATRAFVGAFGAGISLAIAGSVALLLVSSVIAFRGWPDDLAGTSVPDAAELSKPSSGSSTDKAVAVALPPAVSSTAASKGNGAGGVSGASGSSAGQAAEAGSGSAVTVVREPGGSSEAAASNGTSSSPLVTAKDDPVTTVTNSVTGATQTVTQAVAPVVTGALESVGAGGPGGAEIKTGSVVEKVTQAVGNAGELLVP